LRGRWPYPAPNASGRGSGDDVPADKTMQNWPGAAARRELQLFRNVCIAPQTLPDHE
jgi:hypothetical protein